MDRRRGLSGISIASCILISALAVTHGQADSGAPDEPEALEAAPSPTTLGEVIQAGAKLFGKGDRRESAAREVSEAEPKGTSSQTAKKAALAALPLEQLTGEQKQRVHALLKSTSFYRRLPKITFAVEPEVYQYFISHPDVAVSVWRAMKISKLEMWQTGKYDYEADAGDGSTGTLEILYSDRDRRLVACDGNYKSPLFAKPIVARSLLLLQTSFVRDSEGTVQVTHTADLFVTFPSLTVDVVAKIFSPLTVAMTDRTFAEVSLFLKMMSLAMARRPDWVEELTVKMDGVADVRKDQVRELTTQVHTAAQKQALERVANSLDEQSGARDPVRLDKPAPIPNVPTSGPEAIPVAGSTSQP